jgi:hypothetical protein
VSDQSGHIVFLYEMPFMIRVENTPDGMSSHEKLSYIESLIAYRRYGDSRQYKGRRLDQWHERRDQLEAEIVLFRKSLFDETDTEKAEE